MKKALVISAYPACGKSYYTNTVRGKRVLDSDSSSFSWIIHEDGTKERNPEFPANYIQHIKDNLDTADIILVSSHIQVRKALEDAGIDYVTVYPSKQCKAEWIGRMYLRGNDNDFIDLQAANWDKWIGAVENEPHGSIIVYLKSLHYLDANTVDKITDIISHDDLTNVKRVCL
jgi:hypothetical protein